MWKFRLTLLFVHPSFEDGAAVPLLLLYMPHVYIHAGFQMHYEWRPLVFKSLTPPPQLMAVVRITSRPTAGPNASISDLMS